ncbi:type II toxin-antitoxin system Phd/YefM family antitoxin [Tersicoccus phoenicis]|nr:type II toxin-antitoxin system prevent-host-death family antitoxin [Tersicoccus phoenicis]
MVHRSWTIAHAPRVDVPQAIEHVDGSILCRNLWKIDAMIPMTISAASRTGISGLVSSAEAGQDVVLSRHGRVVAEIVSAEEIARLRRDRELLKDAAIVMARFATDSGVRTDLDSALEAFGLSRNELESEAGSP